MGRNRADFISLSTITHIASFPFYSSVVPSQNPL